MMIVKGLFLRTPVVRVLMQWARRPARGSLLRVRLR